MSGDATRRGTASSADSVQIDFSQLLPRLPAHVLAQFEAVSGLMVVNVTKDEMVAATVRLLSVKNALRAEDKELFAAFDHEMYHYFQAIGTGYVFAHYSRVWRTAKKHLSRYRWRRGLPDRLWLFGQSMLGRVLQLVLGIKKDRWVGWASIYRSQRQFITMQAAAPDGDHSQVAALIPRLGVELNALRSCLDEANVQGLSPLNLIEGGALVYQYARADRDGDWRAKLAHEWSNYDDTYRRAFEMAAALIGERAYDVFLPAAALSLCYEKPQNAFIPIVTLLASMPAGDETAQARIIASKPPGIPGAGRYLGRATDVRATRHHRKFKRYDEILRTLREPDRNLDDFDALTIPGAGPSMATFPFVTTFPFVVTQDAPFAVHGRYAELQATLSVANLILGTASFPRAVRDAKRQMGDFILRSPVISGMRRKD